MNNESNTKCFNIIDKQQYDTNSISTVSYTLAVFTLDEDLFPTKVKSGLKNKLDVGVSSDDTPVKSAFEISMSASEEIKSGFTNISSGEVRVSQREGKAVASEIERKAKLQRLDALAAKRLSDELKMNEQQRKRAAEVQQQAQYYIEEDWDLIRARMEAST
ncbi:hypothetical protein Tco_1204661 [Tanacetum coccineum]